jgi:hypothetical protein
MRSFLGRAVGCTVLLVGSTTAFGQDDDPMSWDRRISRHVKKYCFSCHSEDTSSGNVNLAQDTDVRLLLDHRETWQKALVAIETGEMPPQDEERIPDEKRLELIAFLKKTLNEVHCIDPSSSSIQELSQLD